MRKIQNLGKKSEIESKDWIFFFQKFHILKKIPEIENKKRKIHIFEKMKKQRKSGGIKFFGEILIFWEILKSGDIQT